MSIGLTDIEKLDVIKKKGGSKENVLEILLELQACSPQGYIDRETAVFVANELKMTETKIFEIATFYSMLKVKPQARHVFKVCTSTPCHFSKTKTVTYMLEKLLGIKAGEITYDGLFSYQYIPCFGACDIGPAIKVHDIVYGNIDEEKIRELIEQLRNR